MNKFKYYFILLITTLSLFSCSKNDDTPEVTPLRDYAVQYATDNTAIEEYLKTNYITVVNHPGFADDQDVTFTKIPAGGTQTSIWNQTTYELKSRDVKLHNITYKLYYLMLRQGIKQSPCSVDDVLVQYRGDYLQSTTEAGLTTLTATKFDESPPPFADLNLYYKTINGNLSRAVRGWIEIFPQFKTGSYTTNKDGTVTHKDFGAGVMFIPSGLGYYNNTVSTIPAYSPLVFSFKLYELVRQDQDNDGVPSYLEDLNGDSYMWITEDLPMEAANPDDTDADGIPNFLDVDDDGDNYTTKLEIKNPATGIAYPFADIPTCTSGKKNYLDATCHP